jgi:molybdopterin converting factor small subunit
MALTPEQQALDFNPELQDVNRQRKLAELLMSQATTQPQGQMISGHYVAPSWTQQLQPLFNAAVGTAAANKADTQEQQLAQALRQQKGEALSTFQKLMAKPETRGQAMQFAAGNQFLQPLATKLAEGMKLGEGEKFVMPGMNGESVEVAAGAPKYHPLQTIDMGTKGVLVIDPNTGKREVVQKGVEHAGQVVETENGPMIVDTRTGLAKPIMANGQAVAGGKPLTSDQSNATAFGIRMKESNQILNDLENKGVKNTGVIKSAIAGTVGMTPFIGENLSHGVNATMNTFPSALGGPSAEQQQVEAARKNFITAVLRKESGAAISVSEFYNEALKYFPQPGDSEAVIKQKRHARDTAIRAMEIQAGPGKRQIEQTNLPAEDNGWSVKSVK